jgi:uncharacterized coiled-coil protein SlyX
MSDKKTKKQTPQQIFNQFLFESMMDKLRAVELYEKEVAGYSKQISQHIKDHQENDHKMEIVINDLIKNVESLERWHKNHIDTHLIGNRNDERLNQRITTLEKTPCCNYQRIADLEAVNAELWEKLKEQDEGIASLLKMLTDVEILKTQMKNLIPQLNGVCNKILEMNKKKPGRPKKGE